MLPHFAKNERDLTKTRTKAVSEGTEPRRVRPRGRDYSLDEGWTVSGRGRLLVADGRLRRSGLCLRQGCPGLPAKMVDAAYVEHFLWGSVGLCGVEDQISFETEDGADLLG